MDQKPADTNIDQFIQQMPKAEIHIHLEGSISPETVLEIAERNNLTHILPSDTIEGLHESYIFKDFLHFSDIYWDVVRVLKNAEDFELITYRVGADMAAQNIRYRELTFTPILFSSPLRKILPIEELLEGLDSGRKKAKADFGVEIRWVFDIPREANFPKKGPRIYNPIPSNLTLKHALLGREIGVVGFGLGGYEVNYPPEPYSHVFRKAKSHGLMSVPHAGETVGPESIWGALKELDADRIGHGVRAWEDPVLVEYLAEHQIPLEVNPTSNICLRVYDTFEEHPLRNLDQAGVPVTVNSDDPSFFNTTLNQEYAILVNNFGYSKTDLARIARNAFVFSGLEEAAKKRLLAEHDTWAAAVL